MRYIPPLPVDDKDVFDDIIIAKHDPTKARLRSVRGRVFQGYDAYAASAPEVDGLPSWKVTPGQREALLHAYGSATAPMSKLRGELLMRVEAARCPFCGLGESATLDHYLPKEDHPRFSVYSPNLVPSCSRCNTLKRRLILDQATGVRRFLHPYFDRIPERRFLHANVSIMSGSIIPRFRIEKPPGLPQALYHRLDSHFRSLRLAERYQLMSLDEMRGKYGALLRLYGAAENAKRVAKMLAIEADSLAQEYGINHWRVALFTSLATNDQFCDGGFRAIVSP